MTTPETTCKQAEQSHRIWPWIAFWLTCGMLAWFTEDITRWLVPDRWESPALAVGWVMAINGLLALTAGLCGWSAIQGLAIASLLGCATFLVLTLRGALDSSASSQIWEAELLAQQLEPALYAFNLPFLLTSAAIPLWCCRWRWGWRLSRQQQTTTREPWSVEHLFWATTLVACVVYFCRVPQLYFDLKASQIAIYLPGLATATAACTVLFVMPSIGVCFGTRVSWLGWCWILASTGVSATLLFVLLQFALRDWVSLGSDSWMFHVYASIGATSLYLLGILAMRSCGFRLNRFPRVSASLDPASSTEGLGTIPVEKLQAQDMWGSTTSEPTLLSLPEYPRAMSSGRRWLAGFFLCAVLTALSVSLIRDFRDRQLEENVSIQRQLKSEGGGIRFLQDRHISSLRFPPGTSVRDLNQYGSLSRLMELSLSDCQISKGTLLQLSNMSGSLTSLDLSDSNITDADLQDLLESSMTIYRLNLSGTKITAQGLESIGKMKRLHSLNLSRTKIPSEAIAKFLAECVQIKRIHLEDMGLNDAQLSLLYQSNITGWYLAGNQLTDAGLAVLWQNSPEQLAIDLSRNPIKGRLFGQVEPTNIFHLTIDDVPIDDVTLKRFMQSLQIASSTSLNTSNISLTLGRTKLTGSSLDWLLESKCSKLKLLEGSFIDQELTNQPVVNQVQHLEIRCSQLTGKLLGKFQTLPRYLSLQGSAFSDDDFQFLPKSKGQYATINLADCKVTDKSLPYLEAIQPDYVDLSNTQVTAQGLLEANFPNTQINISLDQFSTDERQILRTHLNLFDDILFLEEYDD